MFELISLAGLAALSAALAGVVIRAGRLDHPGPRSSHTVPTPKGGGVGIAAAFAGTLILVAWVAPTELWQAGILVASALGLALVAFYDDLEDWPFWVKLVAQAVAASAVVAGGFRVEALPVPGIGSGAPWVPLCWLVSIGWIVFVTNAVNFMDGLNGLASGVALITCVTLVLTTSLFGAKADTVVVTASALALGAGIVGFLPLNFPAARVFMGDVGSQLCGFVVAVLCIAVFRAVPAGGAAGVAAWAGPAALAGLLFDVTYTLLRRARRGERLTQAHREHLYQRAHRSGVRAWVVTVLVWSMAAWGACVVILLAHRIASTGAVRPDHFSTILAGLMVLAPQLAWLMWVNSRTRHHGAVPDFK